MWAINQRSTAQFSKLLSGNVMYQPEEHCTVHYAVIRLCYVSTRGALHSSVSCCQCYVSTRGALYSSVSCCQAVLCVNQRSTAQFSMLLSVSCRLSTRGVLHSSLRCCQCHVGYQPVFVPMPMAGFCLSAGRPKRVVLSSRSR